MSIVAERNLFVNTSSVPNGDGRGVNINLPQGYADCGHNQRLKLTLTSFLMEKKFYNVNSTNNIFVLSYLSESSSDVNDIQSFPVDIAPGNYKSFGGLTAYGSGADGTTIDYWYDKDSLGFSLKTAIEKALGVEFDYGNKVWKDITDAPTEALLKVGQTPSRDANELVEVRHDMINGLYTIKITIPTTGVAWTVKVADALIKFFSFEFPTIPTGMAKRVSLTEALFVDTHELLGGCSVSQNIYPDTVDGWKAMPDMFKTTLTTGYIGTGFFQASLQTMEAVYVRTNVPSMNFQTASFDSGGSLYPFVISSDILAKIPVNEFGPLASSAQTFYPISTGTPPATEMVQYGLDNYCYGNHYIGFIDQGGNTWTMMLNTSHVASINIFLTDDKGRSIPWQSAGQQSCNEMYFTATLKVTVME